MVYWPHLRANLTKISGPTNGEKATNSHRTRSSTEPRGLTSDDEDEDWLLRLVRGQLICIEISTEPH